VIDAAAKSSFDECGYLVVRGLFDAEETTFFRDHFMRLREAGSYPGDVVGVQPGSDDPLKRYPRMIHMHRWDGPALDWLLEPRLAHSLSNLLDGLEPFAVQTMLYFMVKLEAGSGGGPCGEWVEHDGRPLIELTGVAVDPRTTE
jgi:hypothetical protein